MSIAPSKDGAFGAWLVAGPWKAQRPALDTAPIGIDETVLTGTAGASLGGERDLGGKQKKPPAKWTVAASGEGAIDLKAALETKDTDVIGYAFGVLHLAKAGKWAEACDKVFDKCSATWKQAIGPVVGMK